jgi:hypothetical protein
MQVTKKSGCETIMSAKSTPVHHFRPIAAVSGFGLVSLRIFEK